MVFHMMPTLLPLLQSDSLQKSLPFLVVKTIRVKYIKASPKIPFSFLSPPSSYPSHSTHTHTLSSILCNNQIHSLLSTESRFTILLTFLIETVEMFSRLRTGGGNEGQQYQSGSNQQQSKNNSNNNTNSSNLSTYGSEYQTSTNNNTSQNRNNSTTNLNSNSNYGNSNDNNRNTTSSQREPSEAGQSSVSSVFSSSNAGSNNSSAVSAATSVSSSWSNNNSNNKGSPKKPSYSQLSSKMETIHDESVGNTNSFSGGNSYGNNERDEDKSKNNNTVTGRRDTLYEDANENVGNSDHDRRGGQQNTTSNKFGNNHNANKQPQSSTITNKKNDKDHPVQSWQQSGGSVSGHSNSGVNSKNNHNNNARQNTYGGNSNNSNSYESNSKNTSSYESNNSSGHGSNNKNSSTHGHSTNDTSAYGNSNDHHHGGNNHAGSTTGTIKNNNNNKSGHERNMSATTGKSASGRSNSGRSNSGRSSTEKINQTSNRNNNEQLPLPNSGRGTTTYNSNGTAQDFPSEMTRGVSNTGYGTKGNSTQDPIARAGDFNDPNADVVFLSSESGSGSTRSPVVRFRIHSDNLRVHSPVLTKKFENNPQTQEHQLEEDAATLKHLFSLMYNRESPILEPNDWQMVLRLARCAQKYDVMRAKERAIAYFTKNEQSGALSPFMTYAFAVQYSLPTLEAAAAERSVRYDVNKIPELIFNMMGFNAFQRLASFHAKRQEYYQDMLNALSIDPKEVADQCYQTGGVCVVTPLARLKQTLAWPRQVGRDATKRAPEPADVLRKIITEIGQIDCGTCAKALVEAGLAIQHTLETLPSYTHEDSN